MGIALGRLAAESLPSACVRTKSLAGPSFPAWVSCTPQIIVDRMKREFGVKPTWAKPPGGLPRNHPQDGGRAEGKVRAPVRGKGQYGHVAQIVNNRSPARASSSSAPSGAVWFLADSSRPWKKGISRSRHARRTGGYGGGRQGHAALRFVPRCGLERSSRQMAAIFRFQGRLPQR